MLRVLCALSESFVLALSALSACRPGRAFLLDPLGSRGSDLLCCVSCCPLVVVAVYRPSRKLIGSSMFLWARPLPALLRSLGGLCYSWPGWWHALQKGGLDGLNSQKAQAKGDAARGGSRQQYKATSWWHACLVCSPGPRPSPTPVGCSAALFPLCNTKRTQTCTLTMHSMYSAGVQSRKRNPTGAPRRQSRPDTHTRAFV
jgi:hypothetical protein